MKKLLYFLCILLFTSTVYASDLDVQENVKENNFMTGLYNTKYISIDNGGGISYIISEEDINILINMLKDILKHNNFTQENLEEQKNELRPVKDFQYRISLYANDESGKRVINFLVYNTGKLDIIVNDTKILKVQLYDNEAVQLISSIEMLFTRQHKYDVFLPLNNMNLTELGSVLDGKLYIFENAFIDSQGSLYISLEDWDNMFSPTYGNTKKLSIRDSEVIYNYKDTGIQGKVVQNKMYLPFREMVGFFTQFDMTWDAQLRKVVISEKT